MKLTLAIVGDLHLASLAGMPGSLPDIRERLWHPAGDADVILANLECPVTRHEEIRNNTKQYSFKVDESALDVLDQRLVLCAANNHIMDFGTKGLIDTLTALDARGFKYCGAGSNMGDACRPLVVESSGVRLGFVAAADPRYESAASNAPGTAPATEEVLKAGLRQLRGRSDFAIATLHMGMEFVPYPTPLMCKLADLCMAEGARLVIFHHAHCVSGWQQHDANVVWWGAGNYLFAPDGEEDYYPWGVTAVLRVSLDSATGIISSVSAVPVVLDTAHGFPSEARGSSREKLERWLTKLCRRTAKPGGCAMYRWLYLFRWSYLAIVIPNFWFILRKEGFRGMLGTVWSTLKVQFAGKNVAEGVR